MRSWRTTVTWLLVLAALALFSAAGALAAGPSAGDQQYVDPLGGSGTPSSHPAGSGSTPTASATPSAGSASSSTVGSSSSAATTTTTGSSSATSAATLPRTGYDGWLVAVLGAGLVGGGLAIRRQALTR